MNKLRLLLIPAALVVLLSTLASCASDPRKNCNHPQHGAYMKEQRIKKHGF
jgi:hypothetical protein